METVSIQKAELRTDAQARRDALPADARKAAAEAIAARKFPLAIAPGAIVSGFMPLKSEINPLPLLQKLAEAGARLALPAIAGRGKPLIMRAWEFGAPLDRGQWGIREPKPDALEVEPDILLVPLLAFDRAGHRIGYGAGYYDMTIHRLRAMKPVTILSGFMPLKSEINPLPLMQKLAEAGARLALPAIAGRGKPLIMRAWEFGAPLDRGQWGIREPKPDAPEVEPDILLVPLLAFDRAGYRHRLWRRLLRYDHPSVAGVEAGHRRRHCLCRPGGSKNSDDTARRAPRSRANRARGDRFARQVSMRILFVGDVVGRSGRTVVFERLPGLVEKWKLDLVVVNGENSAGGFGITEAIYRELIEAGADAITLGNHAWDQKEALVFIERAPKLVRPINYPAGTPGRGAAMIEAKNGARVLVINAMGRIFMDPLDDPFAAVDRELMACPLGKAADAIIRRLPWRGDQREAGVRPFLRWPR